MNLDVGGKPNFWLYPLDKFHMEIADDSQLKTKIMLYFLCLARPLAHLKDLPSHEAEYDMVDKTAAEKEREDRDRLVAKEIAILKSPKKSAPKMLQKEKSKQSASKLPSISTSNKKLPSTTVIPSAVKLLAKGNKEWWEKYNFSNPVLIRYRLENKFDTNNPVVGANYYVG